MNMKRSENKKPLHVVNPAVLMVGSVYYVVEFHKSDREMLLPSSASTKSNKSNRSLNRYKTN